MARNRQRASERKRRERNLDGSVDGVAPDGVDDDPNPIHREMVPGPVEHTGEVDQVESRIVAGADGEPEDDPDAVGRAVEAVPAGTLSEEPAVRGPGRFRAFLRASAAELRRVQWPDRRHVGQATAVVLGFVVVAGAFLGLADVVADRIVDLII